MSSGPQAQSAKSRMRSTSARSEEHTSELQSPCNIVCRLLLEKKKTNKTLPLLPRAPHLLPALASYVLLLLYRTPLIQPAHHDLVFLRPILSRFTTHCHASLLV